LIFVNAVWPYPGNVRFMREESHELARLNRRIADVRRSIEEAERHDNKPWSGSEQTKMLALLNQTLKDLETRKAALERANQ
jgi:hypothetical protein